MGRFGEDNKTALLRLPHTSATAASARRRSHRHIAEVEQLVSAQGEPAALPVAVAPALLGQIATHRLLQVQVHRASSRSTREREWKVPSRAGKEEAKGAGGGGERSGVMCRAIMRASVGERVGERRKKLAPPVSTPQVHLPRPSADMAAAASQAAQQQPCVCIRNSGYAAGLLLGVCSSKVPSQALLCCVEC